ncbi:MAG: ATP-binding cassette domain-containing protein, partial [Deltaproteobacteria bacterium]
MPEPAIQVRGVRKEFGGIVALDRIDLEVAAGEFVCLLGPSGCGKSTLLNAIAGFTRPSAGEILAFGKPVQQPEPARAMV